MRNARANNAHNFACSLAERAQAAHMRASYINPNQRVFNGENGLPDRLHQTFVFRCQLYLCESIKNKFRKRKCKHNCIRKTMSNFLKTFILLFF